MSELFKLECAKCGKLFTTPTRIGLCPHCGVSFEIIWEAPYKSPLPPSDPRLAPWPADATDVSAGGTICDSVGPDGSEK